ncbi:hypothetical protein GWK08_04775 [Leptobacterium flavescens]|uniref:histidine kinase n=1 Tax=Leptobacterium flavescens TaxID=472055 RepID=A0A6P0UPA3_9FLAO|nr:ATP-binding protein [Leptobacterium flavescens]NER12743.1 hypothetical protein [Leptobacterium flavescens]
MKTIYPLLIFIFSFQAAYTQQNIEDFKKIVDTTGNQELKLRYLDSLIASSRDNIDDFVTYSEEYIGLAEEMKRYDDAVRKGVRVFYHINTLQNRNKDALTLIERLQQHESKLKDSFLIGSIYLKKGGAYYSNDFDKAVENYTKAIEKFGRKDSIFVADSYLFRGQSYSALGNYVQAVKDYEKASTYYEDRNDKEYAISTRQAIAVIYSINGFYDYAKRLRGENLEYSSRNKLYRSMMVSLVNQAFDYKKQERYKEQEEYLLRALELGSKHEKNNLFALVNINSSLANLYARLGDKEKVKTHLDSISAKMEGFNENPELWTHYLLSSSHYKRLIGKNREALQDMIKAHNKAKEWGDKDATLDIKRELPELYSLNNQPTRSYEAFREYSHLKDSLFNVQRTNSLLYFQTLYETERKEREIMEQESSIRMLKMENESKNRILILTISSLSLLFLIIYLYRNKVYLTRSKRLQESFSQQLLVSQEQERRRISKDLHDGLGQSLLLIKNKIVRSEDENTKTMVNNAIEEVRSISKALHPFQLEELGITKAIENVIYQLDESTDIFISSEIDDIQHTFSPEKEVNIFRIIQESVNNIIKHSQAHAAKLIIKKSKDLIKIVIKDNGKGFDFSEKYNDLTSLGLKTLKERTKFLDGNMRINSEKGKGTTIDFIIPIT